MVGCQMHACLDFFDIPGFRKKLNPFKYLVKSFPR
jgi:hypothetical protein